MSDRVMSYTIAIEPEASAEGEHILVEGLVAYNTAHAGPANYRGLSLLLRDGAGGIFGGVAGVTQWDWLFIKLLWVSEELRGRGFGRALVASAEQEALARGCTNVYLDTFSFQARGFYERLGYEVFGELPDFPPGHTRFFLRKCNLATL